MLKAAVPRPTATSRRSERPLRGERAPRRRGTRAARGSGAVRDGSRASCFQSATMFSTIVSERGALDHLDQPDLAEVGEQRTEQQRAARPCRPAASRTAAPRHAGARLAGARSVASARPGGLRRVQPGADQQEGERRRRPGRSTTGPCVSPDRTMSANGMIASPPNCSSVPIQMYGHAPPAEHRAVRVRAEADQRAERREHSGSDTISATSQAGTPSSTIITRLSVPVEQHHRHADRDLEQRQAQQPRAAAARRVAASANGRKRGPTRVQPRARAALSRFIAARAPAPARCRSRWRCARCAPAANAASPGSPATRRAQRRLRDRLDRRRAVAAREQPADRVHHRQQRRARREGEQQRGLGARARSRASSGHRRPPAR